MFKRFRNITAAWLGMDRDLAEEITETASPSKYWARQAFSDALDDDNPMTPEQCSMLLDGLDQSDEEIQRMKVILGPRNKAARINKVAETAQEVMDISRIGPTVDPDTGILGFNVRVDLSAEKTLVLLKPNGESFPCPWTGGQMAGFAMYCAMNYGKPIVDTWENVPETSREELVQEHFINWFNGTGLPTIRDQFYQEGWIFGQLDYSVLWRSESTTAPTPKQVLQMQSYTERFSVDEGGRATSVTLNFPNNQNLMLTTSIDAGLERLRDEYERAIYREDNPGKEPMPLGLHDLESGPPTTSFFDEFIIVRPKGGGHGDGKTIYLRNVHSNNTPDKVADWIARNVYDDPEGFATDRYDFIEAEYRPENNREHVNVIDRQGYSLEEAQRLISQASPGSIKMNESGTVNPLIDPATGEPVKFELKYGLAPARVPEDQLSDPGIGASEVVYFYTPDEVYYAPYDKYDYSHSTNDMISNLQDVTGLNMEEIRQGYIAFYTTGASMRSTYSGIIPTRDEVRAVYEDYPEIVSVTLNSYDKVPVEEFLKPVAPEDEGLPIGASFTAPAMEKPEIKPIQEGEKAYWTVQGNTEVEVVSIDGDETGVTYYGTSYKAKTEDLVHVDNGLPGNEEKVNFQFTNDGRIVFSTGYIDGHTLRKGLQEAGLYDHDHVYLRGVIQKGTAYIQHGETTSSNIRLLYGRAPFIENIRDEDGVDMPIREYLEFKENEGKVLPEWAHEITGNDEPPRSYSAGGTWQFALVEDHLYYWDPEQVKQKQMSKYFKYQFSTDDIKTLHVLQGNVNLDAHMPVAKVVMVQNYDDSRDAVEQMVRLAVPDAIRMEYKYETTDLPPPEPGVARDPEGNPLLFPTQQYEDPLYFDRIRGNIPESVVPEHTYEEPIVYRWLRFDSSSYKGTGDLQNVNAGTPILQAIQSIPINWNKLGRYWSDDSWVNASDFGGYPHAQFSIRLTAQVDRDDVECDWNEIVTDEEIAEYGGGGYGETVYRIEGECYDHDDAYSYVADEMEEELRNEYENDSYLHDSVVDELENEYDPDYDFDDDDFIDEETGMFDSDAYDEAVESARQEYVNDNLEDRLDTAIQDRVDDELTDRIYDRLSDYEDEYGHCSEGDCEDAASALGKECRPDCEQQTYGADEMELTVCGGCPINVLECEIFAKGELVMRIPFQHVVHRLPDISEVRAVYKPLGTLWGMRPLEDLSEARRTAPRGSERKLGGKGLQIGDRVVISDPDFDMYNGEEGTITYVTGGGNYHVNLDSGIEMAFHADSVNPINSQLAVGGRATWNNGSGQYVEVNVDDIAGDDVLVSYPNGVEFWVPKGELSPVTNEPLKAGDKVEMTDWLTGEVLTGEVVNDVGFPNSQAFVEFDKFDVEPMWVSPDVLKKVKTKDDNKVFSPDDYVQYQTYDGWHDAQVISYNPESHHTYTLLDIDSGKKVFATEDTVRDPLDDPNAGKDSQNNGSADKGKKTFNKGDKVMLNFGAGAPPVEATVDSVGSGTGYGGGTYDVSYTGPNGEKLHYYGAYVSQLTPIDDPKQLSVGDQVIYQAKYSDEPYSSKPGKPYIFTVQTLPTATSGTDPDVKITGTGEMNGEFIVPISTLSYTDGTPVKTPSQATNSKPIETKTDAPEGFWKDNKGFLFDNREQAADALEYEKRRNMVDPPPESTYERPVLYRWMRPSKGYYSGDKPPEIPEILDDVKLKMEGLGHCWSDDPWVNGYNPEFGDFPRSNYSVRLTGIVDRSAVKYDWNEILTNDEVRRVQNNPALVENLKNKDTTQSNPQSKEDLPFDIGDRVRDDVGDEGKVVSLGHPHNPDSIYNVGVLFDGFEQVIWSDPVSLINLSKSSGEETSTGLKIGDEIIDSDGDLGEIVDGPNEDGDWKVTFPEHGYTEWFEKEELTPVDDYEATSEYGFEIGQRVVDSDDDHGKIIGFGKGKHKGTAHVQFDGGSKLWVDEDDLTDEEQWQEENGSGWSEDEPYLIDDEWMDHESAMDAIQNLYGEEAHESAMHDLLYYEGDQFKESLGQQFEEMYPEPSKEDFEEPDFTEEDYLLQEELKMQGEPTLFEDIPSGQTYEDALKPHQQWESWDEWDQAKTDYIEDNFDEDELREIYEEQYYEYYDAVLEQYLSEAFHSSDPSGYDSSSYSGGSGYGGGYSSGYSSQSMHNHEFRSLVETYFSSERKRPAYYEGKPIKYEPNSEQSSYGAKEKEFTLHRGSDIDLIRVEVFSYDKIIFDQKIDETMHVPEDDPIEGDHQRDEYFEDPNTDPLFDPAIYQNPTTQRQPEKRVRANYFWKSADAPPTLFDTAPYDIGTPEWDAEYDESQEYRHLYRGLSVEADSVPRALYQLKIEWDQVGAYWTDNEEVARKFAGFGYENSNTYAVILEGYTSEDNILCDWNNITPIKDYAHAWEMGRWGSKEWIRGYDGQWRNFDEVEEEVREMEEVTIREDHEYEIQDLLAEKAFELGVDPDEYIEEHLEAELQRLVGEQLDSRVMDAIEMMREDNMLDLYEPEIYPGEGTNDLTKYFAPEWLNTAQEMFGANLYEDMECEQFIFGEDESEITLQNGSEVILDAVHVYQDNEYVWGMKFQKKITAEEFLKQAGPRVEDELLMFDRSDSIDSGNQFLLDPEGNFHAWSKGDGSYGEALIALEGEGSYFGDLDTDLRTDWRLNKGQDTFDMYRDEGWATGQASSGGFLLVNSPRGLTPEQAGALLDVIRAGNYWSVVLHEKGKKQHFKGARDAVNYLGMVALG